MSDSSWLPGFDESRRKRQTDEELATLIAQTLRLDMTVMDPPPWPEHPDAPEEH